MVFINGELYENVNIYCDENITTLIVNLRDRWGEDLMRKVDFQTLVDNNYDVTVFYISNCHVSNFDTNINVLHDYVDKGLPISKFTPINEISRNNFDMLFVNPGEYKYAKRLISSTTNIEEQTLSLNRMELMQLKNVMTNVTDYNFMHGAGVVHVPKNSAFFKLEIRDMPIPIENLFVFKKVDNELYFVHDAHIKMWYPSIYELDGFNDYYVYYIYSDDCEKASTKYTNEVRVYHKYIKDWFIRYELYTIPDMIKLWKPVELTYDIKNFQSYEQYNDVIEYNITKLTEAIKKNAEYYDKYLNKIIGRVPGIYVDVSQIDIFERIRFNNMQEIEDPNKHVLFKEPQYVFIFRFDDLNQNLQLNVWLDGYLTIPDYVFYDERYVYMYFPTRFVAENSILEIEKFYESNFKKDIEFKNTEDLIPINIKRGRINSVTEYYLVDREGNYIDESKYDFYVYYDKTGVYYPLDKLVYAKYESLYIKANDLSIVNQPLQLLTNFTNTIVLQHRLGSSFEVEGIPMQRDPNKIRIFKNGQLMPSDRYDIIFDENHRGKHIFRVMVSSNKRDTFVLTVPPNFHKLVHYQEEIPENGYIDLKGKIDKPINLKWHDIYLNGLRMNKSNIEQISAFKFIFKNVQTRANLYIYEKNLDNSFVLDEDFTSPSDEIIDLLPEVGDKITDGLPIIDETLPDIIDDLIDEEDFFVDSILLRIGFINPDWLQISPKVRSLFPKVFAKDKNYYINPNIKRPFKKPFRFLNPDDPYTG